MTKKEIRTLQEEEARRWDQFIRYEDVFGADENDPVYRRLRTAWCTVDEMLQLLGVHRNFDLREMV